MIIEIDKYKLIQEGGTFNLIKTVMSEEVIIEEIDGKKSKIKTGNLIPREVDFGYNMSLDRCLQKIIMENLSDTDLITDLNTWIKMYREEREKITQFINI